MSNTDLMAQQVADAQEIARLKERLEYQEKEIARLRDLGHRVCPGNPGFDASCERAHYGLTSIERRLEDAARMRAEIASLKAELEAINNAWNETAKDVAAKAVEYQEEYGVTLHEALSDSVYGRAVDLALEFKALKAKLEAAEGLVERLERERDEAVDVLDEVWIHHAIDLSPQLCDQLVRLLPRKSKPVCETCGGEGVVEWTECEWDTSEVYDENGDPH